MSITFKVRPNRDGAEHTVTLPGGLMDYVADEASRDDLAMQQLVVKLQAKWRRDYEQHGADGATKRLHAYKYGARSNSAAVVVDAAELGLSAAQIAALEASGAVVVNKPE